MKVKDVQREYNEGKPVAVSGTQYFVLTSPEPIPQYNHRVYGSNRKDAFTRERLTVVDDAVVLAPRADPIVGRDIERMVTYDVAVRELREQAQAKAAQEALEGAEHQLYLHLIDTFPSLDEKYNRWFGVFKLKPSELSRLLGHS
jgi:hypothetical protein